MDGNNQDMFELECLVQNINIKLCARIESGIKQLVALVTTDGDLVLHYIFGELPSVLKRIPWYESKHKVIQAICFDPSATWLLIICMDGSLHILPFLSFVDKSQKVDCKWSTNDLTHFPKPPPTPDSKPTAIVWWQTLDSNQNALTGYEDGTVALISLTDGRCIATCSVNECITNLNLCQDNSLDVIFLLINGISGQQWKHVLEQHSVGYIWPPEYVNQTDDTKISKFNSLKQMGLDKFISLRQRFIEGKNHNKDSTSDTNSESSSIYSDVPELLPHLSETCFLSQYAKDRYLFTAFYKPASLLTVHAVDVDAAPLYSHKLPPETDDILLTDRLIFTLNADRNLIKVVSSNLSECRIDGDSEFNGESLIAQFFLKNVNIMKLYKLTDLRCISTKKTKEEKKAESVYEMPKTVHELNIRRKRIDTCVLVTNKGVYRINMSTQPATKFVHYVLEEENFEKAEKLADIFGLNVQQLLEGCGDLFISRNCITAGISLYKQAKVHVLKRLLKLAISVDCKTLLKYVHSTLGTNRVDMSSATRIHIGNLAVLAYTELVTRFGGDERTDNMKEFMNFLKKNDHYDQVLAVNVACQASLWKIVNLLAKYRGLQPEAVAAFSQILKTSDNSHWHDANFLYALSEPSLTQSLLLAPRRAKIIFRNVQRNAQHIPVDLLRRFLVQLDPSQTCAVPFVCRKFKRMQKTSGTSLESTLESVDFDVEDTKKAGVDAVNEMVETFIVVLLRWVAVNEKMYFNPKYMDRIEPPEPLIPEISLENMPEIDPLSCGYEHAAVVRNDKVYTMGAASSGCLGIGPLLTESSTPMLVKTLADMRVKVLSVSCGRRHTLFLTDYGVYACGSNNYGQLGLGHYVHDAPYPYPICDPLSSVKIVQVVCGQYHSMALTSSGRVYTWGWGVHGQLGHGAINNEWRPRLLKFEHRIRHVAAGHAHSLLLTVEGKVFGFGSNAFGQIAVRTKGRKSSWPVWIAIRTGDVLAVEKVTTGYFHNIAVLENQEVLTWGSSPQEMRLAQTKSAQPLSKTPTDRMFDPRVDVAVNVRTGSVENKIEHVSIGYRHTAILHNGKIFWGKNKDEDLSEPHLKEQNIYKHKFLHVSCGLDFTMALDHIGRLLAWGSVSMAQTILGKAIEDSKRKEDNKVIIMKATRRPILKFPSNIQSNTDNLPIEVPGLPTMIITYNPTDHQSIFSKTHTPYAIIRIENEIIHPKLNKIDKRFLSTFRDINAIPKFKFGAKTLHYVLETYYPLYDNEYIQKCCTWQENYQAASKIALLGEHYCDSLKFQLKAFKDHMDSHRKELIRFKDEYEKYRQQEKEEEDQVEMVKNLRKNSTITNQQQQQSSCSENNLSSSSSLDSIKNWNDQDQGGCESPCEPQGHEIFDLRENMSQIIVQSLMKNNNNPNNSSAGVGQNSQISSVSKLVSGLEDNNHKDNLKNGLGGEIKNENVKNIIEMASSLVLFYIEKIYSSENHILMQKVLMQIIEFWLSKNLPVSILERVLLKNMEKYFYPLSILLFCKDFPGGEGEGGGEEQAEALQYSTRFLKEFSTKFCLQLCLMVVENTNKS